MNKTQQAVMELFTNLSQPREQKLLALKEILLSLGLKVLIDDKIGMFAANENDSEDGFAYYDEGGVVYD